MDMDLTEKITRDINQFKSVPSSQVPPNANMSTPSTTTSWFDSSSSIFNYYTIGIVVVTILMFGAWFAWDWYKTNHKKKEEGKEESQSQSHSQSQPIGGDTVNPISQEKCKNDQKALETALSTSQSGGEPLANDLSEVAGKAGWCYIGEDQGYNVCASVQKNDRCMSGKVYATETECRQK